MPHVGPGSRVDNSAFLLRLSTGLAGQQNPVGSCKSGLEGLRAIQVARHVFDVLPNRARAFSESRTNARHHYTGGDELPDDLTADRARGSRYEDHANLH